MLPSPPCSTAPKSLVLTPSFASAGPSSLALVSPRDDDQQTTIAGPSSPPSRTKTSCVDVAIVYPSPPLTCPPSKRTIPLPDEYHLPFTSPSSPPVRRAMNHDHTLLPSVPETLRRRHSAPPPSADPTRPLSSIQPNINGAVESAHPASGNSDDSIPGPDSGLLTFDEFDDDDGREEGFSLLHKSRTVAGERASPFTELPGLASSGASEDDRDLGTRIRSRGLPTSGSSLSHSSSPDLRWRSSSDDDDNDLSPTFYEHCNVGVNGTSHPSHSTHHELYPVSSSSEHNHNHNNNHSKAPTASCPPTTYASPPSPASPRQNHHLYLDNPNDSKNHLHTRLPPLILPDTTSFHNQHPTRSPDFSPPPSSSMLSFSSPSTSSSISALQTPPDSTRPFALRHLEALGNVLRDVPHDSSILINHYDAAHGKHTPSLSPLTLKHRDDLPSLLEEDVTSFAEFEDAPDEEDEYDAVTTSAPPRPWDIPLPLSPSSPTSASSALTSPSSKSYLTSLPDFPDECGGEDTPYPTSPPRSTSLRASLNLFDLESGRDGRGVDHDEVEGEVDLLPAPESPSRRNFSSLPLLEDEDERISPPSPSRRQLTSLPFVDEAEHQPGLLPPAEQEPSAAREVYINRDPVSPPSPSHYGSLLPLIEAEYDHMVQSPYNIPFSLPNTPSLLFTPPEPTDVPLPPSPTSPSSPLHHSSQLPSTQSYASFPPPSPEETRLRALRLQSLAAERASKAREVALTAYIAQLSLAPVHATLPPLGLNEHDVSAMRTREIQIAIAERAEERRKRKREKERGRELNALLRLKGVQQQQPTWGSGYAYSHSHSYECTRGCGYQDANANGDTDDAPAVLYATGTDRVRNLGGCAGGSGGCADAAKLSRRERKANGPEGMSQLVAKMIFRRRDSLRPLAGRQISATDRIYRKSSLSRMVDDGSLPLPQAEDLHQYYQDNWLSALFPDAVS
ncbi:hypothetical protein BD410DRAFT_830650 [Rickenella mellea]|uniref:Uncharacterized protein n=1 Tax=Rickenella mellea TaxID=50990 RepID=A0A4Y7PU38_9AGAM|nr:hypothetical protein BD410DRAFT_830650 [Rickenella mellea]